jgi:hypothetical protein
MKSLAAGLCSILLASACGTSSSGLPTAPTATLPQGGVSPSGNGPAPIPGTSITSGGVWSCEDGEGDFCIEGGTVSGNDPACFHSWDASGHCKQYDLVAPADGKLVVTMRWAGPSRGLYDPDVFLVAPDGGWTYGSDAWPEKHVSLPIKSGQTYRIVVLSYGPLLQIFTLILDVQLD